MKPDTAAIVVAGGKGLRFGGKIRKQYLLLKGKPILWWSLSAFEKSPSVSSIMLVVPADDMERICRQAKAWKFKKLCAVGVGGDTRADSVRRGLAMVSLASMDIGYIAVHDAVRPLVTPDIVESVIRVTRKTRAALAACPSKDTVKLSNGAGFIHSTPPREKVWLAQTPQIFERKILERAYRTFSRAKVTDDAMLVEKLGVKVRLVESPAENIKVTHPMDLEMAKIILKSRD